MYKTIQKHRGLYKILLRFKKTVYQKTLILYICFSITLTMNFKKTQRYYIYRCSFFWFLAKEKKENRIKRCQPPKVHTPVMKPLKIWAKVTLNITNKKSYRLFLQKKNWPNNSANGSFLLLKWPNYLRKIMNILILELKH
jgi:hypothetical protein